MSSLKIFKVRRLYRYNEKYVLKDQNLYEDPRHMLKRVNYRNYYNYQVEVFAAKPFINSNDELEMRWELLTLEDIQAVRDQCALAALDKKTKKR